jgi:LAS superfamily LD-carboxypeptidase LdcB
MTRKITDQQWLGQQSPNLVDAGRGHLLHPTVKLAFTAMQQKAHSDGIDLQIVSSFRSFERQLAIFNKKWRGEAVLRDANGEVLDNTTLSNTDKLHAILTWSALPGASRHHWGTDLDVYDRESVHQWSGTFELVEEEYLERGPCYLLACWLEENMAEFGFFRPFSKNNGGVAREPWHLSHKAVSIDFEQSRNLEAFTSALLQSDILGKETVLANLPYLFNRYVLNKGISNKSS